MEKYFLQDKPINVRKSRAYFIPFAKEDEYSKNRENSSRFQLLNGTWNFEKYKTFSDVEDDFFVKKLTKTIPVPSAVQAFGYDYMQYTNTSYPFSYNPPYIPNENPTFHYSRTFDLKKDEKTYIVFEGVDSAFYLYINDRFVGYSNISHRISEFDISSFVLEGQNKIDVLVVKWNLGSYLEDQDKLRLSGIFRDIYILSRKAKHIEDFFIETDIDNEDGIVYFSNLSEEDLQIGFSGDKRICKPHEKIKFVVKSAKFWSAEEPNLYLMTIEDENEIIYQNVGIKTSKVVDGIYLFNNQPIKLYGVNRHDFHKTRLSAVTKDDMEKDLYLMKKMNVNAIRTSHYPSSPLFYELCNEYGFYVMSESDLESHGSVTANEVGLDYHSGFSLMANNKDFIYQCELRQVTNYEEHKNFSCVIIFSLGNESGWGENTRAAYQKMRSLTKLPIHYEGLWEYAMSGHFDEYYQVDLDMVSRMYASPDWMKNEYLEDKREHRPLVLCEYEHSMGNGPGGMDRYWEVIESDKRFMGAFIWEWCDHGVEDKKGHILYGGDFNEFEHDGNFCIDGIVSTNREIKSGTLSMKKAYEKVKMTLEDGVLHVFNKNYFVPLKGLIKIYSKEYPVEILPRHEEKIVIDEKDFVACYLEQGEVVAYQQFMESKFEEKIDYMTISYEKHGHQLIVKIGPNSIVFNVDSGEIEKMKFNDEDYGKVKFIIDRAHIDNDMYIGNDWNNHFLRYMKTEVRSYKATPDYLEFNVDFCVPRYFPLIEAKIVYRFVENGVDIELDYQENDKKYYEFLPRIGLYLQLDGQYDHIRYCAYGPYESYADMYKHLIKGVYENDVEKEYHHYVMPQESGSHYDPDYVEVYGKKNVIRATKMKSFSCLPYSVSELQNKKHDYELEKDGKTYLALDYFMSGLGSNSCGPIVEQNARVPSSSKGSICLEFLKR